jgi:hypothetical protein
MSDQPDRFEQILTEIAGLKTGLGAVTTELSRPIHRIDIGGAA